MTRKDWIAQDESGALWMHNLINRIAGWFKYPLDSNKREFYCKSTFGLALRDRSGELEALRKKKS